LFGSDIERSGLNMASERLSDGPALGSTTYDTNILPASDT
jgi:hypothetical protein